MSKEMERQMYYLVIKLFTSENHLGYNGKVEIYGDQSRFRDPQGIVYVSFDHKFPRFIWEKSSLTASTKEYLELKAQIEVEREIKALP